jgi:predicted dehydrogenase
MERRYFLMGSAALAGLVRPRTASSANDTIRIGVVGFNGRGMNHIQAFGAMANVEIAALCDIDAAVMEKGVQAVTRGGKKAPATYVDIRKMLENKSIDAITIATPNHWHTLMTIWGLQAGKDVYVEKPCSYNLFECKQIVAAAKKYGDRIVSHGTQGRAAPAVLEAIEKLRAGVIGDVYLARGLCYKWRDTIKKTPVEPVPAGVDYDLWTGPAPQREFTRNRFHYNWHWFWDTGNGDIGNQGVHEIDIARWGLGVTYPTKVSAIGGHFMFDDDQETPNTLVANYEFLSGGKKKMMTFEVRHWITNDEASIRGANVTNNVIGDTFYGSNGYLAVDTEARYATFVGRRQEAGPALRGGGDTFKNFIEVMRSRKAADLRAPIEEGAISCALIHLANASYRLGRTLNFDEKSMSVAGDKEADAMLTRVYRKPFVVPQTV